MVRYRRPPNWQTAASSWAHDRSAPAIKKCRRRKDYFHDGERFWRVENEYVGGDDGYRTNVDEIDPQTGKKVRASVPKFFETNKRRQDSI